MKFYIDPNRVEFSDDIKEELDIVRRSLQFYFDDDKKFSSIISDMPDADVLWFASVSMGYMSVSDDAAKFHTAYARPWSVDNPESYTEFNAVGFYQQGATVTFYSADNSEVEITPTHIANLIHDAGAMDELKVDIFRIINSAHEAGVVDASSVMIEY